MGTLMVQTLDKIRAFQEQKKNFPVKLSEELYGRLMKILEDAMFDSQTVEEMEYYERELKGTLIDARNHHPEYYFVGEEERLLAREKFEAEWQEALKYLESFSHPLNGKLFSEEIINEIKDIQDAYLLMLKAAQIEYILDSRAFYRGLEGIATEKEKDVSQALVLIQNLIDLMENFAPSKLQGIGNSIDKE